MARTGGLVTVAVGISAALAHFTGTNSQPSGDVAKQVIAAGQDFGTSASDTLEGTLNRFCRPDCADANWVISSVPDPEATRLRLSFDRVIESIQRAASDSECHYSFREFWFPWEPGSHRESDDPKKRSDAEELHRARMSQAGVLLFESSENGKLVVFLVGESPISGLNLDQLSSAEEASEKFCLQNLQGFLGPNFSASWDSLAGFVRHHPDKDVFTITTSLEAQKLAKKKLALGSRIHSFDGPAETSLIEIDKYLQRKWGGNLRRSLLAEDETTFADRVAQEVAQEFPAIRFPREISQLRNAAQEAAALSDPKSKKFQIVSQLVPFSLRETEPRSADVPDFGKSQTPISQESELMQAADALNRQTIHFVGVLATDPLDILFLSRYLHSACANTRLFIVDPDLLMAHGSDSADFEGTLAASWYPLFPQAQVWSNPSLKNISLFASADAQAVYNSTISLLSGPAAPARTQRLWLSILGRSGYWPVDILQGFDQSVLSRPSVDRPTRAWWTSFVLLTFFCVAFSVLVVFVPSDGPRKWTLFSLKTDEPGLPARAFWLFALALSLTLLEALWTVVPLRILHSHWPPNPREWDLLVSVVGSATCLVTLFAAFHCARRIRPSPFRGLAALCSVAFAGLAMCGIYFALSRDPATFFLAFRAIQLTSGVSPLVPMTFVLAGFAVYVYLHLQRVKFHDDRLPWLPDLPGDRFCPNLPKLAKDIDSRIYRFNSSSYDLPVAGVLLTFGLLYVAFHAHQSVEPRLYENIFLLALVVLLAQVGAAYARIVAIWSAFHEFLRQLERHPLRRAFAQLPKDFMWSPTWQGGSTQRTHVLITRSVECLQAIVKAPKTSDRLRGEVRESLEDLQPDLETVLAYAQERKRVSSLIYRRLQQKLAAAGTKIAADLETGRWSEGSYEKRPAERAETPLDDADAKVPVCVESQFLVFRYLAFINYVLIQQQNLITIMMVQFLLVALALNSYPFLSRSIITGLLTAVFIAIAALVASIFAGLDRDPIISRATGTSEGQLDKFFFLKLASFGALPLLAVLGSQFPAVGRFFFSWVQPAVESLH